MSARLPNVDLAALLGAAPDDGIEAIVRVALRPLAHVGLFVFDRDLRLHLAEGPGPAANGYSTEMVRGRRFDDLLSAGMAEQVRPYVEAALAGERHAFDAHSELLGRTYTMDVGPVLGPAGNVLGGVALSLDVTERTGEDAAGMFRLLADTAPELVSLHDLDGSYRYVSPSIRSILGHEPVEVHGRRTFDLIHTEDLPAAQQVVAELVGGCESAVVSSRYRRADGTYVWLESVVQAVRAPSTDRVVQFRASSRDISVRKERERAAQQLTDELRRRLAQTAAVARLGEQALENPDLGELLDASAVAVAETLEVPLSAVLEFRGRGEHLLARAGVGWRAGMAGALIAPVQQDPDDQTLALLADGPVVAPPDRRFHSPVLDEHGVVNSVHAMIGERERPWGLLAVYATEEREFDEPDRDFLQAVAHVIGDAVARRRAEEAARHEALHDPLTRLPNRALLVDRLAHALRRRGTRTGVFLLDLDDFKVINESLGHATGDQLLTEVGPRLAAALRPGDTVARFSGDSFAVVCEDIAGDNHGVRLAERIAGAFAQPFVLGDERVFINASIGVVVSSGIERAEDLVRDADAAMFRAKEGGKGRYELFDPAQRQRSVVRLRIESELRRALGARELRVYYQPFWALPERRLAGVEALVRWEHPERGLVAPGEFIPVAEESGLIVPIGAWVLRESCRQLAEWRRSHAAARRLKLRVNLSARQVTQHGLIDVVSAALGDHGIEPEAVGLEITENLLLQDSEAVAQTLHGLKDVGVALVLDDFGTGYSSLSYLKRFPIDQIKIDRSFVTGVSEEGRDEDRALVAAIVGMASALGLSVVPEGVESEEELAVLTELGCDFAQGFLLARPLEPAAVGDLLRG